MNGPECRRRRPSLGEFKLETASEWINKILMRVLWIGRVIHPLTVEFGASVALESRDQAPATRMNHQVDGSIGRPEQGLNELEPV